MTSLNRNLTATMDIHNACQNILNFTDGFNLDSFSQDMKTLYAVLHQLLIIGEAAKRISNDFKEKHSEIEWGKMAKMRDKIIHHYTNVDAVVVWETIRQNIPKLSSDIQHLLKSY